MSSASVVAEPGVSERLCAVLAVVRQGWQRARVPQGSTVIPDGRDSAYWNHWDATRLREEAWLSQRARELGYIGVSVHPQRRQTWQPAARREYERMVRVMARAFRLPLRLLAPLPPVPAKAAHMRKYQRRRR